MTSRTVLHFGGNGHCSARLDAARAALVRRGDLELIDVPYPGFEGRPHAASVDAFLSSLAGFVRNSERRPVAALGSGIGALIALSLRSGNELLDVPLILQGPVLWGLENRLFPRLMRPRLARRLLQYAFTVAFIQKRFVRKHFRKPMDQSERRRFFAGYAECTAFSDFFEWFTPAWLRTLEARFREHPEATDRVTVWIGGRDDVVGLGEIRATERALGVRWPVSEHPNWGHYPAIDEPEEWAEALHHALDGP